MRKSPAPLPSKLLLLSDHPPIAPVERDSNCLYAESDLEA